MQPDWLLCLARFVSWEGISRTRLEICPNPARCEADSNQWANIRNVISVPLSWKVFSVVCITLPSRTWIHHNTLDGVENDYLTDHLKSLRQIPVNFSILWERIKKLNKKNNSKFGVCVQVKTSVHWIQMFIQLKVRSDFGAKLNFYKLRYSKSALNENMHN